MAGGGGAGKLRGGKFSGDRLARTWEHRHFDMFPIRFLQEFTIEVWEVYGKMGKGGVAIGCPWRNPQPDYSD